MENRGFIVTWVAIAGCGQGLFVILRPRRMIDRLPVFVEDREGSYVVALTICFYVLSLLESRRALLQFIERGWCPYGVIPGASNAPVSHGATWVCLGGSVEGDTRFLVAEGVEKSGCTGDQLLRRGVARDRKVDRAKAGNGVLVLGVIFLCHGKHGAEDC